MSKSPCLTWDRELSQEEDELLIKTALMISRRFYYKKLTKNQYQTICSVCGRESVINKQQLDMVREAGLCLHCANSIRTAVLKKDKAPTREWIKIQTADKVYEGYRVVWRMEDGKIYHTAQHVAHFEYSNGWDRANAWVKGIVKSFSVLVDQPEKDYWRKVRYQYQYSYSSYDGFFSNANYWSSASKLTKRNYYEELDLPELKSNQKTFIKKGIYNPQQIAIIRWFDLNYPEQVHKYRKYIKANYHRISIAEDEKILNESYLAYLDKNNFNVDLFHDYVRYCQILNQPISKPKDLYDEHQKQIEADRVRKLEKYRIAVQERFSEMKSFEYCKNQFQIKAFENVDEMVKVANTLHNCIARIYVPIYAEKRTDVLYGMEDGNITFAIEVNKGALKQLRGAMNNDVNDDVKKFVKEWCKKEHIQYEQIPYHA